mmetsp:Transcript_37673/g.108590  ORF Transcript_37673/g.108590 Transcript_37673/m.108590 type:complete len:95 (-) Transcript_37673:75-359(-)
MAEAWCQPPDSDVASWPAGCEPFLLARESPGSGRDADAKARPATMALPCLRLEDFCRLVADRAPKTVDPVAETNLRLRRCGQVPDHRMGASARG